MQTTELNPYDDISYTQMSVTNVARIVYSGPQLGSFFVPFRLFSIFYGLGG